MVGYDIANGTLRRERAALVTEEKFEMGSGTEFLNKNHTYIIAHVIVAMFCMI